MTTSTTHHRRLAYTAFATWLASLVALPLVASAQNVGGPGEDVARRAVHVCASCHGDAGHSKSPAIPHLAGQPAQYLVTQLKDFRSQQRSEADNRAYMWGVSALLDDSTIQSLADYYAGLPPAPGHRPAAGRRTDLALGQQIFEKGIPARNVRACAACHGERAEGQAGFPRLAGQQADYLFAQIKGFGGRLRPHGVLMKNEVAGMKQSEMRAVALYLQSMN